MAENSLIRSVRLLALASVCSCHRPVLGNMVGFGRDDLLSAWWIAMAPAAVIFLDPVHERFRRLAERSPRPDAPFGGAAIGNRPPMDTKR